MTLFKEVTGFQFVDKKIVSFCAAQRNPDVFAVSQCCGANAFPTGCDFSYYLKKDRGDYDSGIRVKVGNKGVLLVPGLAEKQIVGSNRHHYNLPNTTFTLYTADQPLETWWHDAEIFKCGSYGSHPSGTTGISARALDLWNNYSIVEGSRRAAKPPEGKGVVYTNYWSTVSMGNMYKDNVSFEKFCQYGYGKTPDEYGLWKNSATHVINQQLDEGAVAFFILTEQQINAFKEVLKANDLTKYIIGSHPGVYNLNYLARRLNVFVLYKGI